MKELNCKNLENVSGGDEYVAIRGNKVLNSKIYNNVGELKTDIEKTGLNRDTFHVYNLLASTEGGTVTKGLEMVYDQSLGRYASDVTAVPEDLTHIT